MKVLLSFVSLCVIVSPVNAVHGKDGRLLGKPISEDVERRLKKMNTERRNALSRNQRSKDEPAPGYRRLGNVAPIISRPKGRRSNRKLPYYTGTINAELFLQTRYCFC